MKGKTGPKTPEGKARSLANLRPARKGEVRNPGGRPSAGASVKERINEMQGLTTEQLKAIADDASAPANKKLAAKIWIQATVDGSQGAFDRIVEHTDCKAPQSMNVKMDATVTHADQFHAAMEKVMGDPEALAVAERLADLLADAEDSALTN